MVSLIKHVKSHVLHSVALLLSYQITHSCINRRLIDPVLIGHVVSENEFVQDLVMKVFVSFAIQQSMCIVVVFNTVLIMVLHIWVLSLALFYIPRLLVIFGNVLLKLSFHAVKLSCWGQDYTWIFNRVFTV